MRLRNLELKDAPLMLEWMHDESKVCKLKGNFIEKTLADAESFILASANKEDNIHLAIVSDEDEYMGTVSLKNIDKKNLYAEFAIVVRSFNWSCDLRTYMARNTLATERLCSLRSCFRLL